VGKKADHTFGAGPRRWLLALMKNPKAQAVACLWDLKVIVDEQRAEKEGAKGRERGSKGGRPETRAEGQHDCEPSTIGTCPVNVKQCDKP